MGLHDEKAEDLIRPDSAQRAVIEADPSARLVVEAGPGSGKTRVACQRVAWLMRRDVAPSRIWMVSFTRGAVGEILERIASFLPDPATAAEVTVVTLDSLAWRLRHGFTEPEDRVPEIGYDQNISEIVALLEQRQSGVVDFLGRVEHLVLDEAQDLTGYRRTLVTTLVTTLRSKCGVTLFIDSAQAIYGFSDNIGHGQQIQVKDLLLADSRLHFDEVRLDTDHRTRTPKLKHFFAAARTLLLNEGADGRHRYQEVRELIEEASDGAFSTESEQQRPSAGSTLRLFRYRGQMMTAAAEMWAKETSFTLRLADRQPTVVPWVGALLSRIEIQLLTKDEFEGLWMALWPPTANILESDAWAVLRRLGPGPGGTVRLVAVRERLAMPTPPLEVTTRSFGQGGIVLSTIHGAKGHEADHVQLVLPRDPVDNDDIDWDEEARVLFVGATRARRSLRLGAGASGVRKGAGLKRLWRHRKFATGMNAMVEFGLDYDVDVQAQVTTGLWSASDGVGKAQKRLWEVAASSSTIPLVAVREGRDDKFAIFEENAVDGSVPIGFLSARVISDLWVIGKEIHGAWFTPPHRIKGLRLIGARTAAMTGNELSASTQIALPYATTGMWLVPIVAGVAPVFFHVQAGSGPEASNA
jgi:hypothetical protein